MGKTTTIRARIEPDLKNEVDSILTQLGLTASETIHLLYRQIKMRQGLPFDVHIPNDLTEKTLKMSKAASSVVSRASFFPSMLLISRIRKARIGESPLKSLPLRSPVTKLLASARLEWEAK